MTFSQVEMDAFRVSNDLNIGNAEDAAAVLRNAMYYYPQDFSILLHEISKWSSPNRRDDLVNDNYGNLLVRDRYTGQELMVGKPGNVGLPPILPPIDLGGHL